MKSLCPKSEQIFKNYHKKLLHLPLTWTSLKLGASNAYKCTFWRKKIMCVGWGNYVYFQSLIEDELL